jgi:small GTP-binding protein
MGLFDFLKRQTKNKVVFCGLDSAGKSTIISFLQTGHFIEHTPTLGKVRTDMEVQGTRMSVFDMGGQASFRKMWMGEITQSKCIVYVVDSANQGRFPEAREELQKILPTIQANNTAFILIANKADLGNAADISTLVEALNLEALENFQVIRTSAKTGLNMADAFATVYSILTGELIRKRTLTQAVTIFNVCGEPLVTKAKTDQEFNQAVLRGGFLSAITSFLAAATSEHVRMMQISVNDTVFLVARGEKIICSVLWTSALSVPVEESKQALNGLIEHLEYLSDCTDPEVIERHVDAYCTNIM